MEHVADALSYKLPDQIHSNFDETLQNQSVIHRPHMPSSSQVDALEVTNLQKSGTKSRNGSCQSISGQKERTSESMWKSVTKEELIKQSLSELKKVLDNLSNVVEDVSSELVRLLEERQNLQDEVDIRNIAIEQLWKVQSKLQWKLTEPQLGIQMSVIFPSDNSETVNCQ